MKKTHISTQSLLAMMVLGLAGWHLRAAENGIPLVTAGKATAVMVLPDGAGLRSAETQAASLLADMFRQMSGADLHIVHEKELGPVRLDGGRVEIDPAALAAASSGEAHAAAGKPGVAAGDQAASTPDMHFILIGPTTLAARLGVTDEGLGVGGMRVKTVGNALVLVGGPVGAATHSDDGGLRYAALEVLERLGCRYLWPGESGRVVPRRDTLALPALDISITPVVGRRYLRWARLHARGLSGLERLGIDRDTWQAAYEQALAADCPTSWGAWQRLGGRMPGFGHAGAGLRHAEVHMETHPEWFALQADGSRDQGGNPRWRLCKSNPELRAHVAADIIQRRIENPDLPLVSLDPNDGGYVSWCMCANCQALDPQHGRPRTLTLFEKAGKPQRYTIEYVSLTDRLVSYWNSIAERVTTVYPDLLFGVSAYGLFTDPPVERTLHPNLLVRYVPPDPDLWDGWLKAGTKRMYYRPNILLANRRHGKLMSIVHRMARNMRYFAEAGMTMTDFDSIYHHWATFGLTYYATARLNWNPYLPADEIIADYARQGFGAGAAPVERYFQRVEALTETGVHASHATPEDYRYTPEVAAELRALLNAAEEAVSGDERIRARIAFLRLGLNFTELHETLDDMSRRAAQGEQVNLDRARLLVDLNCLVLRDILQRHNLAINVPGLVWGSGTFARWTPVQGRRVQPSDSELLERLADPRYGLTGREQGLDDMLAAFGMPAAGAE